MAMKLKAKPGVKGVGVGGLEYEVDKKGYVTVPDEFVAAVLDAGFVMAEGAESDEAPAPTPAPSPAPTPEPTPAPTPAPSK
jgi:hypothetical protein